MLSYLISILYYLIPAAAITFFVGSLISYFKAKNKNKQVPGTYSAEQMKTRKICLIASSVIAGLLLIVVLAFIGLLMMAVAFM